MWILLPLLAAICAAYIIIRRLRLVRERRERAQSIEIVEAHFLKASQKFSMPLATDLLRSIQTGKQLRRKYLQPELQRLERAISSASKWNDATDPEQERTAVLTGVAHLYVKWRENRTLLEQ
jgi:hypothetical protein